MSTAQDRNAPSRFRFAGVALTKGAIEDAKRFYIENARACIAEAQDGRVSVNDLPSYVQWREESIRGWEAEPFGDVTRPSLALLQRAHYEQTGTSIPLLPPTSTP